MLQTCEKNDKLVNEKGKVKKNKTIKGQKIM